MSEPIGPGDWVECVDAAPRRWPTTLVVGAIYEVLEVVTPSVIRVRGAIHHPLTAGFYIDRFRPVYRRRDAESLTAKLLEGARAKGPLVPAMVVREDSRETIKNTVEVEGE